jgi:hypothetical protein
MAASINNEAGTDFIFSIHFKLTVQRYSQLSCSEQCRINKFRHGELSPLLRSSANRVLKALCNTMKLSREIKVRPKFLSIVLFFIGTLLSIGGWYTVGTWLPLILASMILAFTKSENVVDMCSIKQYQIACIIFAFISITVLGIFSYIYALSWLLVTIILSYSFKPIRWFLGVIGVLSLFTNV